MHWHVCIRFFIKSEKNIFRLWQTRAYESGLSRYGTSSRCYGTNSGCYDESSKCYGASSGCYGASSLCYGTSSGCYGASSRWTDANSWWTDASSWCTGTSLGWTGASSCSTDQGGARVRSWLTDATVNLSVTLMQPKKGFELLLNPLDNLTRTLILDYNKDISNCLYILVSANALPAPRTVMTKPTKTLFRRQ